jgi:hypothetical protein
MIERQIFQMLLLERYGAPLLLVLRSRPVS